MPQILIILASALLIIKQFFGSFKVTDNQKKAFTVILLAILIYIGYRFWLKSKEDKEIGTNVNAQLASRLKLAFDPYGLGGIGTDEDEVFKVAEEIKAKTKYEDVAGSYQTLYSKSLTTDLQSELSPSDYAKFVQIISQSGVLPTPTPTPTIKQVKTVAVAKTYKIGTGKSEVIKSNIPKGTILGRYVGDGTLYFSGNPYVGAMFEYSEFSWIPPYFMVVTQGIVLKSQVSIS